MRHRTRDRECVHRISVTSLFLAVPAPSFPPSAPPLHYPSLGLSSVLVRLASLSRLRDNDVSRVRSVFLHNRGGEGEGNRMPCFLVCARQCSVAPFEVEFACRQHGGRCGGATIVVSKREECLRDDNSATVPGTTSILAPIVSHRWFSSSFISSSIVSSIFFSSSFSSSFVSPVSLFFSFASPFFLGNCPGDSSSGDDDDDNDENDGDDESTRRLLLRLCSDRRFRRCGAYR